MTDEQTIQEKPKTKINKTYSVEIRLDLTIGDIEARSVGSALRKAEREIRKHTDRIKNLDDEGGIVQGVYLHGEDGTGGYLNITREDREKLVEYAVNPTIMADFNPDTKENRVEKKDPEKPAKKERVCCCKKNCALCDDDARCPSCEHCPDFKIPEDDDEEPDSKE